MIPANAAPTMPRAKTLRPALGLTQEELAARFQIPLGTLRDWEQGKAEPDQSARAYLRQLRRQRRSEASWLQVSRLLNAAAPVPRLNSAVVISATAMRVTA